MNKFEDLFRKQLNEAIRIVRDSPGTTQHISPESDFYRGMQAGASQVAVEFEKIRQRDCEHRWSCNGDYCLDCGVR